MRARFVNEEFLNDLDPYTLGRNIYGRKLPKNNLAIGWLDVGMDFPKGDVPDEAVNKMRNMRASESHKGSHECPFCGKAKSSEVKKVTHNGISYNFPGMVPHYIKVHGYKPPQEFIEAVLKSNELDKPVFKRNTGPAQFRR